MPNDPIPSSKNLDLLDILVCPKCKGALSLRETPPAFTCSQCRLAFAIVDDIPNFIEEDATAL
jgi:uncharacterized protein YbaR (Trm112 family)